VTNGKGEVFYSSWPFDAGLGVRQAHPSYSWASAAAEHWLCRQAPAEPYARPSWECRQRLD
jgi:hypothetical protein